MHVVTPAWRIKLLTSLTSSCNVCLCGRRLEEEWMRFFVFSSMTKTPIVLLPSGDMVKCELLCILAQESAVTFSPELAG